MLRTLQQHAGQVQDGFLVVTELRVADTCDEYQYRVRVCDEGDEEREGER